MFFARMTIRRGDQWAPVAECMDPYREERISVGFWDGEDWCENNTGHSVMEDWRVPYWTPTHWMPLPIPPEAQL